MSIIHLPNAFENSPIIIWGAGISYQKTIHLFPPLNIIMFLDNDTKKQLSLFEERPVRSPNFLKMHYLKNEKILVFVTMYESIKSTLEENGLREEVDFIFPYIYIYKNFIQNQIFKNEKL